MISLTISVSSLCLIFQAVVGASSNSLQTSSHNPATQEYSSNSIRKVPFSPIWPDGLYTQSSYYYADYKIPQNPPKPKFLPDPPSCPQTGGTVCQEIETYPSDQVDEVIKAATSAAVKGFNFSSLFMDERENDADPRFKQPTPTYEPTGKAYVVYQATVPVIPVSYLEHQNKRYKRINHDIQVTPETYADSYIRGLQFDQKSSDYRKPNYFPPASILTNNYPQKLDGEQKRNQGTKSNPAAELSYYPPSFEYPKYPSEAPDYRRLTVRSVTENSNGFYVEQEKFPAKSRVKRQSEEEEIEDICRTQKQFISPRAALNDRAEWKYIVNIGERDPRVKQVIKVDVCSNANEPCSNQISLPFGFVSRCKQKYIKKKLLSLDPDGQGTSSENFFVPSCCVCEIVRANK